MLANLGPLAVDLMILAGLLSLGGLIAALAMRKTDLLGILALALPLGLGAFTWMLFIFSFAGVGLSRASVIALYLGAMGGLILVGRRRGRLPGDIRGLRLARRTLLGSGQQALITAGWLVLLAVLATAMVISAGRAHSRWDEIVNWAVKGYGIAAEGSIDGASHWGAFGRAYPLNIHLTMTIFKLIDGDVFPGSKLVFPLYLLSMSLGCIWFWRRLRVPRLHAILAGVLLATVPVVFLHGTLAYANLPYATYLVLGSLLGIMQMATGDRGFSLLQGMLYGMAAWTRTEGVGFIIALGVLLVLMRLLAGKPLLDGLIWVLPAIVMLGPWWAFSAQDVARSHLRSAVAIFLDDWSIGNLHSEELVALPITLGRRLLTPSIWGMYLAAILSVSAIGLLRLRRRLPPEFLAVAASAIVTSLLVFAIFYIRSYSKAGYLDFLDRAFDRAFFPGAALLWASAVAFLGGLDPEQPADATDPPPVAGE